MVKLKPCPFCGRDVELKFVIIDEPVTNSDKYYQIRCDNCRNVCLRYTVRSLIDEEEHAKAKERLIEAWQNRPAAKENT